ncbi:MAG: M24 family metallopeptidase [Calditrichaeota bacterium]|nr:MAG: M24 family metallopeptidase [Calditrichota bacterium]
MDLQKIQQAIQAEGFDGWLLANFHNRDHLAIKILGLDPNKFCSRRWYYYIPAEGEPVKLVSMVEKTMLDSLPGKKLTYLAWKELHSRLKEMLGNHQRIAMNYSPFNNIPYTSLVDGGTLELLRSFGYEILSAANLIQQFEAIIDENGYHSHVEAGKRVLKIKDEAFQRISDAVRNGEKVTEYEIQQFIMKRFSEEGLTCEEHGPIVGINDHPADPHFEPTPENSYTFAEGQSVLIDLWAKLDQPGSIYYDVTWCGYIGQNPPSEYVEIFNTVRDARKAAVNFIREKFERGEPCYGWEVDDACRNVVKAAGYGDYFIHRTGHSIGENVHGNGVNIDNLETKDERLLVPGICFSIEPGIYLEGKMAARSEINVFITLNGEVVVAGDEQEDLILM